MKKTTTKRRKRENHELPRLDEKKLRDFVLRFCDGKIYTHHDVPAQQLHLTFMPLAFGGLADWTKTELKQIGCIYGDIGKDTMSGWGINGKPMFFSLAMLHVEDWKRAKLAIQKELVRRETIEV